MQLFVFLFDIYAIRAVYYHKLRRITEMSEQRNVSIVIFLTLWVFAEIVCLFLQKPRVFAAVVCLFLQFRTIVCLFLRCRCCEAAENAFETLKWFAEPMILIVNRILTKRSIMTQGIEMKKKKKKKKKIRKNFEFWNSKDLQNSKGFAKSKRICRIRKDLQNPKGFAESERICKIQKDLWNSKGFMKFKRICRIQKNL